VFDEPAGHADSLHISDTISDSVVQTAENASNKPYRIVNHGQSQLEVLCESIDTSRHVRLRAYLQFLGGGTCIPSITVST
jgi:hypothetical protein